jgi:hypothetical protein
LIVRGRQASDSLAHSFLWKEDFRISKSQISELET